MDQTDQAEIQPQAPRIRKLAMRGGLMIGLMVMFVWSIILPVLGILYIGHHFL